MSYPQPNTGNSMNNLFSRLSDFYQLCGHILTARTLIEFDVWLAKLLLIDRRSTILFIEKHKDEIPEEYMSLARRNCKYDF